MDRRCVFWTVSSGTGNLIDRSFVPEALRLSLCASALCKGSELHFQNSIEKILRQNLDCPPALVSAT